MLQQWLTDEPPEHDLGQQAHDVLDRLVVATQLRFPIVGELARSARFRWFDQPVTEAVRADALAGVPRRARLPDLPIPTRPTTPSGSRRWPRSRSRSCGSWPSGWSAGIPEREPMLEVLARRHYREHELHDLRSFTAAGRPFVTCDYTLDDRPTRLVTTVAQLAELDGSADPRGLVTALGELVASTPPGHETVVDLYLHWPGAPDTAEAASASLQAVLGSLPQSSSRYAG